MSILPTVMGPLPGIPAHCSSIYRGEISSLLSGAVGGRCCLLQGAGQTDPACTDRSPSHHCYAALKPDSFYGPILGTCDCSQHIADPAQAGRYPLGPVPPEIHAVLTGAAPPGLNQPGLSQPCRSWKTQPCCSSSYASEAREMGTNLLKKNPNLFPVSLAAPRLLSSREHSRPDL